MSFLHDDDDFDALLQLVAANRGLGVALVEKDYWVTHTLWALRAQGFDVWFKGGTSLSKGFGIIERFSEDLDLKLEPGTVAALRSVTNWKSEGTKATAERRAHFETLATVLWVPGAKVTPGIMADATFRSVNLQIDYPGKHQASLDPVRSSSPTTMPSATTKASEVSSFHPGYHPVTTMDRWTPFNAARGLAVCSTSIIGPLHDSRVRVSGHYDVQTTCKPIGACGPSQGYLSTVACNMGSSVSCCMPLDKCSGSQTLMCCSGSATFRPACIDGQVTCLPGPSPC